MSIKDLHVYDWKIKKYKEMIIRDGFYIPVLNVLLYATLKDFYLTTIIIQKLYVANYYYHYEHLYDLRIQDIWFLFCIIFIRKSCHSHIMFIL